MKTNGAVIFNGPSRINGDPIIAVIVFKSTNDKTGNMAQVHIIKEDKHPFEALKDDSDVAICGNCPLRYVVNADTGKRKRICYVRTEQGPGMVYKQYRLGNYPEMSPEQAGVMLHTMKQGVRLGAYGDPAAVDVGIWQRLLGAASTFHTAYTHQWKADHFQADLLTIAMASIDHENTIEQLAELHPGSRWYRLKTADEALLPGEIACPSKANGKRKIQCANCKLCAGTSRNAKNIAIVEGS